MSDSFIQESKLAELITKAANSNQVPVYHFRDATFSPGYIVITLCNEEVASFDTYYYTAKGNASVFIDKIISRISETKKLNVDELQSQLTASQARVAELELAKGNAVLEFVDLVLETGQLSGADINWLNNYACEFIESAKG